MLIFGVYLNKNSRQEIQKEIMTKIRKIKKIIQKRTDHYNLGLQRKTKWDIQNKKMIKSELMKKNFNIKTRRQIFINKKKESTLDYILATKQIANLKTEQVNETSDHKILIGEIETKMVKKRKHYKISKTKRIPNKED